MSHSWVTVAVPFGPQGAAGARTELRKMGNPATTAVRDALRQTLAIHFISAGVIDGHPGEPAHLVIEASSDLAPQPTIEFIAKALGAWLAPALRAAGVEGDLGNVLTRYRVKTGQGLLNQPGLDFTGTPGMSVPRIRDEWQLARDLRDLFDEKAFSGSALQVLDEVREEFRTAAKFEGLRHLLTPQPAPCLNAPPPTGSALAVVGALLAPAILTFFWPGLIAGALITGLAVWAASGTGAATMALTGLAGLAASIALLLACAGGLYATLLRREAQDRPDDSLLDAAVLDMIAEDENQVAQNHMTGVSRMKPGRLRRLTLRLAFWIIGQFARTQYRPGFLGDIGTIHFARWVLLPKTDQLLFFSNYGGSWESYLEDFITKAHFGLTGVWSNTEGFPRASSLFLDGATDGDHFKRWARRQQISTSFWYTAYPHTTTARIRAAASIRQGLASAATREEAELWLAQLTSRTPPPDLLQTAEIQTLLFGGLKHHPHAVLLALRSPSDRAGAQGLLRGLRPLVGFGDQPNPERVAMLALGPGLMAKVGLSDADLASFPYALRDGMASKRRGKILGDTGDDQAAQWLWGAGAAAADAAIVLYAAKPAELKAAEKEVLAAIAAAGADVIHRVALRDLDDQAQASGQGPKNQDKEAFGFADGVSQPIIKGTRRWRSERDAMHEVEPGEFILGYPDNRGRLPLTPTVLSERDPGNLLSTIAPPPPGRFAPDLSDSHANLDRDLGRNGAYLVIRQLAQDVKAFDNTVAAVGKAISSHPSVPAGLEGEQLEQWIAAKMVGRWKDGTSLVRYPNRPGTGWKGEFPHIIPDNDFLLGEEDPVGLRCPFGSHIRRSNPRDSFDPGSKEQLAIVNRHRILRTGRRYDAYTRHDGKTEDGGLMFMCFNADIERQFEFIQQTWTMAPQFHGLDNEVDAILGRGKTMGRLTIPTPNGPLQLKGLPDLVRVRGGGYFFVPSRAALNFLAAD